MGIIVPLGVFDFEESDCKEAEIVEWWEYERWNE